MATGRPVARYLFIVTIAVWSFQTDNKCFAGTVPTTSERPPALSSTRRQACNVSDTDIDTARVFVCTVATNDSSMIWHRLHGDTSDIMATCHPSTNHCLNPYPFAHASSHGTTSVLKIAAAYWDSTGGEVECGEFINNTETRVQLDPVIRECLSGQRTVTEDTDVTFNCSSYSNSLEWGFPTSSYIGYCEQTQCNPSLGYPYSLQATSVGQDQYSSRLTIRNITRNQALDLVCRDIQSGKQSTCKLRVTVPGRLVNGSCSLQLWRWYVEGSCRFTGMYDSDNNYTCVWRKDNDELLTEVKDRQSYTTLNGRQYVRGSCFYNQSVPTETGTYRYSVSTSTGLVDLFTASISIMVPGLPSHDCPETVPEGSDITCTCRCSVIGNPPARVVWDGLNATTLALHNVRREFNSLVYTCRLTWGPDDVINHNVSYVVRVAYEPSDADIESTTQGKENGTENSQLHTSVSSESVSKGLIGGVVASVIIIIIIVVVIIVYIIKRRKGTGCMNVTEVPTDSGRGVYNIVPWSVRSDRTPIAYDMYAAEHSEDEYNVLKVDDGSVHDDAGDSYNHVQLT